MFELCIKKKSNVLLEFPFFFFLTSTKHFLELFFKYVQPTVYNMLPDMTVMSKGRDNGFSPKPEGNLLDRSPRWSPVLSSWKT